MKKGSKSKSSSVSKRFEPDITGIINTIQQQLVSLEKKIDTLISLSSERPSEERHFSKPFRHFDRNRHHDRRSQNDGPRERSFTRAICADCNKECEVPFKPSGDRPVYCSECFAKRKSTGLFREKYDKRPKEGRANQWRHFDKQGSNEDRRPGKRKKPFFRRRKERI
ncbi:MAG: hypothetical protein KBB01_04095 [Candidatus Omnitrophica bacterium]|jgi:CxxC-x17-CxxC domain-containing protein|nr:hypothetical protein [Candidatus Omnitrophota bacterium]